MPDADNINLSLSLAIPYAFIFSRGIDRNVYFLLSSTTSHSSGTTSLLSLSHSALFARWCQSLGKARMRVDKTERCLDKPTFGGEGFADRARVSMYRFRFVIGRLTLAATQRAPHCYEWMMFFVRISEDDRTSPTDYFVFDSRAWVTVEQCSSRII